jgi:hypothetical protein
MISTVNGVATSGNRNSQSKPCQIPARQVRLTAIDSKKPLAWQEEKANSAD